VAITAARVNIKPVPTRTDAGKQYKYYILLLDILSYNGVANFAATEDFQSVPMHTDEGKTKNAAMRRNQVFNDSTKC